MAKKQSKYVCQSCAYESPRWLGKCPNCGEWNSFVEELIKNVALKKGVRVSTHPSVLSLDQVDTKEDQRIPTGIGEFDRVLGGGIVRGSVVLLGGDPGVGKSTLMMQLASSVKGQRVLYVSGEESPRQIKLRAERLQMPKDDSFFVVTETDIDQIISVTGCPDRRLDTDDVPSAIREFTWECRTGTRMHSTVYAFCEGKIGFCISNWSCYEGGCYSRPESS
jgi:DNA repair protein RadA/Sms